MDKKLDLAVDSVEPALVAVVLAQVDPLAEHVEELVHRSAVATIAEQALFGDLPVTLVDQAKLVVVDNHMLVIGDNQFRGARAQDRLKLVQSEVGAEKPKECKRVTRRINQPG